MKKLLFAPLLVIFLMGSGCQNSPEQTLFEAHSDLNAAKTRVLGYVVKERCSVTITVNCADQSVVDELKGEVADADTKFSTAWASVNDINTGAARASVTTIETTLSTNNID